MRTEPHGGPPACSTCPHSHWWEGGLSARCCRCCSATGRPTWREVPGPEPEPWSNLRCLETLQETYQRSRGSCQGQGWSQAGTRWTVGEWGSLRLCLHSLYLLQVGDPGQENHRQPREMGWGHSCIRPLAAGTCPVCLGCCSQGLPESCTGRWSWRPGRATGRRCWMTWRDCWCRLCTLSRQCTGSGRRRRRSSARSSCCS